MTDHLRHSGVSLTERLNAHIEAVAWMEHGIVVIERKGASPRAETIRVRPGRGGRAKRIVIKPVKGRVSYFYALHEIGHHLAPRQRTRLEEEVVAWRWALANTIVEPTRGVWKAIRRSLLSYMARAERWQNMKLPPQGHDFYRLLVEADERANA